LAQAIVQTDRGSSGKIALSAQAEGLRSATSSLRVRSAEIRQSLPPSFRQSVPNWRQSPVQRERPRVITDLADNDMNSWDPVIAGERPPAASGDGYVVVSTRVPLTEAMMKSGAVLNFVGISGSGEVLVNGTVAGRKDDAAPGPLNVPIPGGKAEVAVGLVLKATGGAPVGLSGPVFIEAQNKR
jgi:beta-galactosidase